VNIIVVGCGRLGSTLAYQLYKKQHQITVIDQRAEAFDNLPPDFGGRSVEGDILAQEVLHRAQISAADGVAAVTNSDTLNAVVAHIARSVYHIANVVSRNYDPRYRPLHEAFGVQMVSSASWGTQRLEELLCNQAVRAVFSAGNAEVEFYEFTVPAAWQGCAPRDVLPAESCVLAAVTRAGRAMLPDAALRLAAGDVLYLSATLEGIDALYRRVEAKEVTPCLS